MSFLDCLELHKLTVFNADAAKRQRFYIQQAVRKPQRANVWQRISQMGVLNDYIKPLPTLKDSSKAVPTTKTGNIPFGEADLPLKDKILILQNILYRVLDMSTWYNILYHTIQYIIFNKNFKIYSK